MECISIVVPLYKGVKYIDKILRNINRNREKMEECKLDCEIELIFVNDFPEDENEIRKKELKLNNIVFLYNEKNEGIHRARVTGLKVATGNYILMLDQDDEIADDFCAQQYKIMISSNAPMVIANGYIEHSEYVRPVYKNIAMQKMTKYLFFYAMLDNRIISPGQCLIRKNKIPKEWINDYLKNNGADDLLLWALLIQKCDKKPVINTNKIYVHRNTDVNTSLNYLLMYDSVDEMLRYLKMVNFKNKRFIKISKYRNDLLKENRSNEKVNILIRIMVNLICFTRRYLYCK